jgi:hypothetical protein
VKKKHVQRHGDATGFPDLGKFIWKGGGISGSQVIQLGRGFGRFRNSPNKNRLSPQTLYELSVEAIERDFAIIGIAERFEESIFCFAALLGVPSVAPWVTDTRNKGRQPVEELKQNERDLIREVYHWDFELYDWVLKRFEEQCSRVRFGPSLERYKNDCSGQYRDRLLGITADDAVARWMTRPDGRGVAAQG